MPSISTERRGKNVRYRIWFADANGKRKSFRSGSSKRDAEATANRIGAISEARALGQPLTPSQLEWLSTIGDDLATALAAAGIMPERSTMRLAIGDYIQDYIDSRRGDVSARAINIFETTRDHLLRFFPATTDIRSITEADAEDFQRHLLRLVSRVTTAGYIKKTKQFFRYAYRKRLIASNPFGEIKAGSQANSERQYFVPHTDIERVIAQAPDPQWRLLIALGRYGGLRVPSEALRLRWGDIDWEKGTLLVRSPKTAKVGKPTRVLPIFPELGVYLNEAWDVAPDDEEFCISRYRSQDVNLRTMLRRYIERAGLEHWPRLWQNLRSSRETELTKEYPLHIVTQWLGNTPRVAAAHYLQVTDEDIAKANGGWCKLGAEGAGKRQKAAPPVAPLSANSSGNSVFLGENAHSEYTPEDSNL